MAQGVDGEVGLAALAPFGPVPAGAVPAFGRALEGAAVQHHGAGGGSAALAKTDQLAQVDDDRGEHLGRDPAPGLLVDGVPGGKSWGM
jgi:hypothetical protein